MPLPETEHANVAELRALVSQHARIIAELETILGPHWNASALRELVAVEEEYRGLSARYERDREILERSRAELEKSLTAVDDLRAELSVISGQYHSEEEDRAFADLLRVRAEDETRWLRGEFRKLQRYDLANAAMPGEEETEFPHSFEELVERLPDLSEQGAVFTGSVSIVRKLTDLDSTGKCAVNTWEALLTLCSYVRARRADDFSGSFKQYLDDTPSGYRKYPPGKHATAESGATMDQYGHLRVFPVPAGVGSSDSASMPAHFKLARIGMQSPRMHYLDDYAASGKVYIGYIGPHLKVVTTN